MRECFDTYEITLTAVGPVFIGSGREIGKKEYLLLRDEIAVFDMGKLYAFLRRKRLEQSFEEFLLGNSRERDLDQWLKKQKISPPNILGCARYHLKGDFSLERGTRLQLMEFVKDPYGLPYVPGSSLKGMLRTILLGAQICARPDIYRSEKQALESELHRRSGRKILEKNCAAIEAIRYRSLQRNPKAPGDAVNDIMAGFIVGDSQPLDLKYLIPCQKIERNLQGKEKSLNLLRECLAPGTVIRFPLTIDRTLCKITPEEIRQAVARFSNQYYEHFSKEFWGIGKPKENEVFLGGGSGFLSKTVVYPLYGRPKGVQITQEIFEKTKVPKSHKHDNDTSLGVSPHIIKCTRYRGKTLQMGLCQFDI